MNGETKLILDELAKLEQRMEKRTTLLFKKYDENVERIQKVDKTVGILGIRVSINHAILFMIIAGLVTSAFWVWRTR